LLGHLRLWLGRNGSLNGRKVLVTAGGTQEPIDPVRVITNRSSGKQGYAIAQAALDQGAQVTLVSAPSALDTPIGIELVNVSTADEMKEAVITAAGEAELLIMTAAVADYRPATAAEKKIKKDQGGVDNIRLERTPDILEAVAANRKKGSGPVVVIGFAAETENLVNNAKKKLKKKNLDLIAANDVSRQDSGIGADQNQVTLIWKDGSQKDLPLMDKTAVAEELISEAAKILAG
jgi:phosphopantothenoylcysteine decarboxylase/phosphopantothenate--cysteine ligase